MQHPPLTTQHSLSLPHGTPLPSPHSTCFPHHTASPPLNTGHSHFACPLCLLTEFKLLFTTEIKSHILLKISLFLSLLLSTGDREAEAWLKGNAEWTFFPSCSKEGGWGWKEGSLVKSTRSSCGGPEFKP